MKGILMKPDMIQAVVDGRKTVTRRLDGLKEINQDPDSWKCVGDLSSYNSGEAMRIGFEHKRLYLRNVTPRYQVGETVYIKEAWKAGLRDDGAYLTLYKDGGSKLGLCEPAAHRFAHYERKWQSPLFMPEWAARHFIKILAVRAERLQAITARDCEAEGIDGRGMLDCYILNDFRTVWDSINPTYPWESNPWVFPYEFEFVKGTT